jgi:hypothetical protein
MATAVEMGGGVRAARAGRGSTRTTARSGGITGARSTGSGAAATGARVFIASPSTRPESASTFRARASFSSRSARTSARRAS